MIVGEGAVVNRQNRVICKDGASCSLDVSHKGGVGEGNGAVLKDDGPIAIFCQIHKAGVLKQYADPTQVDGALR